MSSCHYRCFVLLSLSFVCSFTCTHALNDCSEYLHERELELEQELTAAQLLLNEAVDELESLEGSSHAWTQHMLQQVKTRVLERENVFWQANPAPLADPFTQTCADGEYLRLVSGSADYEGRVEIKSGEQWRKLCETGWSKTSAQLICSMLGYAGKSAVAVGGRVFGYTSGYVFPPSGTCNQAPGVICENLGKYTVHLINGSTPHEGRVEIYMAGQWGTVCGNSFWNYKAARVVCRMLGFGSGRALAMSKAMFGRGTREVWIEDIQCDGSESHLLECDGRFGFTTTCEHSYDAGVVCDDFFNYPIRLVNGSAPNEGMVEVLLEGKWSPVYDAYWDSTEATVVCRQLGYNGAGAKPVYNSYFGTTFTEALVGEFLCEGNEQHLLECPMNHAVKYNPWNVMRNAAGVICPV